MAETPDRESQTEEPTEKRIFDAVEKGNVPFSRETVTFGSLLALVFVLNFVTPWSAGQVAGPLRAILVHAGEIDLGDREAAATLIATLGEALMTPILPVLALLAAGSIIGSLAQNVPSAAAERITPKASRISPLAGLRRLYGKAGLVEYLKSVIKLILVFGIAATMVWQDAGAFMAALRLDTAILPHSILGWLAEIVLALCLISLMAALADLAWSRFKWRRELRMTRQQVKEEMKEAEGNPEVKSRIRSIARQLSSRRMLEKLPMATLVVVNPTHYAVALRYERSEAAAPVVVAKGVDHLALRIREIAAGHDIPVIEDKPLARALYDSVDLDAQIPPAFYRAVAEIIHFVNSRRPPLVPLCRQ